MKESIDHCFLIEGSGRFSFEGQFVLEIVACQTDEIGLIEITVNNQLYWSRIAAECNPFFKY